MRWVADSRRNRDIEECVDAEMKSTRLFLLYTLYTSWMTTQTLGRIMLHSSFKEHRVGFSATHNKVAI